MIFGREIDFMGVRKIAAAISCVLVVGSIISLVINSLEFGLDFTSGTSVRLNYADTIDMDEVNGVLQTNGYEDAVVVSFGSDRDIRIILPVDESVAVEDQAAQAVEIGATIATVLSSTSASQI